MSNEEEIAQVLATLHSAQQDVNYVGDVFSQDEDVLRLVGRIAPLLAQLFGHIDGAGFHDSSESVLAG